MISAETLAQVDTIKQKMKDEARKRYEIQRTKFEIIVFSRNEFAYIEARKFETVFH